MNSNLHTVLLRQRHPPPQNIVSTISAVTACMYAWFPTRYVSISGMQPMPTGFVTDMLVPSLGSGGVSDSSCPPPACNPSPLNSHVSIYVLLNQHGLSLTSCLLLSQNPCKVRGSSNSIFCKLRSQPVYVQHLALTSILPIKQFLQ